MMEDVASPPWDVLIRALDSAQKSASRRHVWLVLLGGFVFGTYTSSVNVMEVLVFFVSALRDHTGLGCKHKEGAQQPQSSGLLDLLP